MLSETFDTNARYVLSFAHGTRSDYPGGQVEAQIYVGGALVGTVTSAAPDAGGWRMGSLVIEGDDFAAHDGQAMEVRFVRTGDPGGQAQIDRLWLSKSQSPGTGPRVSTDVPIDNGGFDQAGLEDGALTATVEGWSTSSAGTWNPPASSASTGTSGDNVLYLNTGGHAEQVLSEPFDASERYVLRFNHGTRSDHPGGSVTARIYAGGTAVGAVSVAAPPAGHWLAQALVIDGATFSDHDGQALTLRFENDAVASGQALIDGVSLVRETASVWIGETTNETVVPPLQGNAIEAGDGNDTVHGSGRDDTIDGGAGEDLLQGGGGDDTYHVDSTGDIVVEGVDEGHDTVISSAAAADGAVGLSDNVEDGVVDTAAGGMIVGNGLDNDLEGGVGADSLLGGLGADTLSGDAGADTLVGGSGNDVLAGGLGSDLLNGGDDGDILAGDDGDDLLHGEAGDDLLYGGAGTDTLSGDAGADLLHGEAGDDQIIGGTGDDYLSGGSRRRLAGRRGRVGQPRWWRRRRQPGGWLGCR